MATDHAFATPIDIANRACQLLGVSRITSFTDNSKQAAELGAAYDKVRQYELRRNVWRFSIRKAVLRPINTPLMPSASTPASGPVVNNMPSLVLIPPIWSAGTVYAFGSIVDDGTGSWWVNTMDINLGNNPITVGGTAWDTYFGSPIVSPYDTTGSTGYYPGELVYETNQAGVVQVYACLLQGNPNSTQGANASVDPSVTAEWSSTVLYSRGQVVLSGGFYYQSTIDLNQNNTPGAYTLWNNQISYSLAATVAGIDGNLYQSLVASNVGNDPLTSTGLWTATGVKNPWTPAFSTGAGSDQWCSQFAGVVSPNINYPVGTGPIQQTASRNIFQLPNGYMREAPQDPKAGSTSFLGAPTGLMYDDWTFEGDYFTSRQANPIVFRFAADINQVQKMDPMFCEGFANRLAFATCETITQSEAKLASIASEFKLIMGDARTVNGIETGPTEPPEDDYITCRI